MSERLDASVRAGHEVHRVKVLYIQMRQFFLALHDYVMRFHHRGPRGGLGVLFGLMAAGQLALAPVSAQLLPERNRGIPSGSPVREDDARSDRDSQDRPPPVDAGSAAPDYRIEPIEIRDNGGVSVPNVSETSTHTKAPPPPNEFDRFVTQVTGETLTRFGASLLLPGSRDFALPATATVPPDYVLNVGDVVAISMAGSVEGSVERQIDTNGRIFLPRVGAVQLAGVRYGDLKDVISAAIGTQFRGYTVNVSVPQLRGIRIYVTGFANNPGAYTVSSLSTMVNAVLAAGGPSAGGSFRTIRLVRNNEVIREMDLYDVILRGDKSSDAILQNQDVIQIEPLGKEVAITGSVNSPAIFEAKAGETLETLLGYAGGMSSLADTGRLMLYRLADFNEVGVREIERARAASTALAAGDIVQVLSEGSLARPIAKQSVLVRVEGEVERPGNYYLPASSSVGDALAQAGGLTREAYVFGTRFERVSVQRQQRVSFGEALQQMEVALAAAPLSQGLNSNAGERASQLAAAQAVLQKLREAQPDGRIVLDISATSSQLPADFILENNDRIVIPPRPTTVGVFGAVYRPASFAYDRRGSLTVKQYLERAGGVLRAGDRGEIFVVRANGAVLSKRDGALSARALPGDVIFVPVRAQSSSLWTKIRELSTIVFQLGLSAAAFISVTN